MSLSKKRKIESIDSSAENTDDNLDTIKIKKGFIMFEFMNMNMTLFHGLQCLFFGQYFFIY